MIKVKRHIAFFMAFIAPAIAFASDYETLTSITGTEYGFHQGDENAPLLIVMTTDIKESMTDVYSPVGGILASKGYSVAAIDVTCHGKDLKRKEKYGLDCWRSRSDHTDQNVFDGYIRNLKSVISDIADKHATDIKGITVLGVSRGGYLAMKAASEIPEVSIVIALAPVTDVFRLREFEGSKASNSLYVLNGYYPTLATKHLFIQINNNDDRVGTAQALAFMNGVTQARSPEAVDLTAVITPKKGHSTSEHEMAAAWALTRRQKAESQDAQMSAPK